MNYILSMRHYRQNSIVLVFLFHFGVAQFPLKAHGGLMIGPVEVVDSLIQRVP